MTSSCLIYISNDLDVIDIDKEILRFDDVVTKNGKKPSVHIINYLKQKQKKKHFWVACATILNQYNQK